jgi:hypothetical protein
VRRAGATAAVVAALLVAGVAPAAAAPSVDYSCTPAPASCAGWYRQPVSVHWTWLPSTATVEDGCRDDRIDFDTRGTTVFCKVSDAGTATTVEVPIRVDSTPPTVTGSAPSRPPDHNGWYRGPLQVAFSGIDATSGVQSCAPAGYGGPDTASALLTGTCTDVAGNVSAPSTFAFRYDATPPAVAPPRALPGDGVVRLRWRAPADATSVELTRSPGLRGAVRTVVHTARSGTFKDRRVRNGGAYEYSLWAADAAGNVSVAAVRSVPGRRLLSPARGATVRAPATLLWTSVRRARYYNVQLFRGGRKILSAWPRDSRLTLPKRWRFAGRRYQLRRGHYRWYVWPGFGPRARERYGALIGRSSFVIARP